MPRYGQNRLFSGFNNGFRAFAVLFLEHWTVFCVDWRYGCQDTGECIYSPALKLSLQRWQFRTLEVILCRLEVPLPRYGRNRLLSSFKIGFTAFAVLFLEHRRLFFIDWRYFCQDTGETVYYPALKLGLPHSPFFFRTSEEILRRFEVRLQRYVGKHLFAGFEIVFTPFTVQFLEQWRLFCVN